MMRMQKNITTKIDAHHKQITSMQKDNFVRGERIAGIQTDLDDNLKKTHNKKTSLSQYQMSFKQQMVSVVKRF